MISDARVQDKKLSPNLINQINKTPHASIKFQCHISTVRVGGEWGDGGGSLQMLVVCIDTTSVDNYTEKPDPCFHGGQRHGTGTSWGTVTSPVVMPRCLFWKAVKGNQDALVGDVGMVPSAVFMVAV